MNFFKFNTLEKQTKLVVTLSILFVATAQIFAQGPPPPPPPPPPGLPIDGGLLFLVATAVGYGLKRIK